MSNELQKTKLVRLLSPQLLDAATGTSAALDTAGFSYLTVAVMTGAMDIGITALSITECDTSGGQYAAVTGTVFGTAANMAGSTSALPGSLDDNKLWAFDIDLRGRKRYVKIALTAGDGSTGVYVAALGILSRATEGPDTQTERGCEEVLRV